MEKSAECLKKSIDGETTAAKQYKAFATKAREDNYPNIASLFKSLAYAESIHIKNHTSALGDPSYTASIEEFTVGSTVENLKRAIEGENYENKKMYPKFFKEIKKEQNTEYGKVAMLSMQWSSKVEKNHAKMLHKALLCIEKSNDFHTANIYICKVCGNLEIDQPTRACTVCGHDSSFFKHLSVVSE